MSPQTVVRAGKLSVYIFYMLTLNWPYHADRIVALTLVQQPQHSQLCPP